MVEYDVDVPAGIDSQNRIRVGGMGNPSRHGGPPGDLYCDVTVKEHALFHREGPHLVLQAPINYSQAALGGVLEVPTLEGKKDLTIPPGTQPNEVFRLRGLGMPTPNRAGRGDLVVQVVIEVPKQLTERQEKLLRELAEEEHVNVSAHRKSFFDKLRAYFVNHDATKSSRSV
jgi:molecular chaperone DnaJ